jgi:hypothetical protein
VKKYIFIFTIISLPFVLLILDKTLPKKNNNLPSYYTKIEDINKLIKDNGDKINTDGIDIIKYNEKN